MIDGNGLFCTRQRVKDRIKPPPYAKVRLYMVCMSRQNGMAIKRVGVRSFATVNNLAWLNGRNYVVFA